MSDQDDNLIDNEEHSLISKTKLIASSLSILGSVFIILFYIYLKHKVRVSRKKTKHATHTSIKLGLGHTLILWLAISDTFSSLSSFFVVDTPSKDSVSFACKAQGATSTFFDSLSICVVTLITLTIYHYTQEKTTVKIHKFICFCLYAFLLPCFLTIGPMITDSYGPSGGWCWLHLDDREDTAAWTWSVIQYTSGWIHIVINFYFINACLEHFKVKMFEFNVEGDSEYNKYKHFCVMLKIFPLILLFGRLFGTLSRGVFFISGNEYEFLTVLHAFFWNIQGLFNALAYSFYYRDLLKQKDKGKVATERPVEIKS